MSLENLPLDGSVLVSSNVGVKHEEHISSPDLSLDEPKELETFFIWDLRERIVWKIISDVRMKRRVGVPVSIVNHSGVGRLVTNESRFHRDEIISVSSNLRHSFVVNCETFIKPEVGPIGTCDGISSP